MRAAHTCVCICPICGVCMSVCGTLHVCVIIACVCVCACVSTCLQSEVLDESNAMIVDPIHPNRRLSAAVDTLRAFVVSDGVSVTRIGCTGYP